MPSQLHEVLVALFHERPALAAELLTGALGVPVPEHREVRLESCELADVVPTEYRADAVVVLTDGDQPVLAVVIEIQLGRDRGKRWSWPVYLATLRSRLRCRVVLLVLCSTTTIAEWCAVPIDLGHPGWVLRPLVVGPDRVPIITEPSDAEQSPELAVLSAMAHGAEPAHGEKVLSALLAGLRSIDDEHLTRYHDLVLSALPAAARACLEDMMTAGTYEYMSDFVRRNVNQGRAEGKADAVLAVLAARGIAVTDDAKARITACTDLAQLDAWITRAVAIDSADELFD
ncbi:MAG: hypothetical protein GEU97_03345 [Actinophytocola sp.]|nr:hypothetical protein [Actinophytocola sp.]